jgi:diguanylate cyclase (GGDEF)-like protein/PAS domain S-box-containing protein/putative nucleotidyltransferase with HDIG domain
MLHPLLARQLKRLGIKAGVVGIAGDAWQQLLERVSRTYTDADQDRYTIERSLTISSDEMHRLYKGLEGEKRVLELIAGGAPLLEVLDALSRSIEEQSVEGICSLSLLDSEGVYLRSAAAPSLPAGYLKKKGDVTIGPKVGSCGTAAFSREPVIVSDIATDPLWDAYRDLALEYGLRACWSTPILSSNGDVLGTFAMYYNKPQEPTALDLPLVARATHLAGIAIEHERSENALRESEAHLRTVVTNTPVVLFAMDGEGMFTLSEGKGLDALGLAPGEVVGLSVYDVYRDEPQLLESVQRAFSGEEFTATVEVVAAGLAFETRFAPVTDTSGKVVGLTGVANDITERKRADETLRKRAEELEALNQQLVAAHQQLEASEQQLKEYASRLERTVEVEHEQAVTDSLTGLANHRGAHLELDALVAQAHKTGQPLSLVLGDIDGFKLFNDTYGHTCGDDVLRLVAEVCRSVCRPKDIACRYGGDEFVLILPGSTREDAAMVARRISETFATRAYITEDGSRLPVSLALGHATLPQDATSVEQLIAAADAAMYQAKRTSSTEDRPMSSVSGAESTDTTFGVLDSLVQAIDAKDRYTKRHSDVVAEYAIKLASRLDLSEESTRALRIAGLLHDIGKLVVPDEVLKKPGRLTDKEYDIVKRHVVIGEVLIREVPQLKDVIQAVSCHHERFDGSGYPRGLAGMEIPLLGRVIAIADAYSAMVLDRPYRKAMKIDRIIEEFRDGAGTQFDPEFARVFVALLLGESGQQLAA